MRVLIVGMTESVHVARWVSQITQQGWDIRIFPSTESRVHPLLARLKVKIYHADLLQYLAGRTRREWIRLPLSLLRLVLKRMLPPRKTRVLLGRIVKSFRPDIIHSLETQHAGYLVLETKEKFSGKVPFPSWLHTNYGSDLYLFGNLPEHAPRIREVLFQCDYYSCESRRDVNLAREFGFSKSIVGCFPNTGGFDVRAIRRQREAIRPSERKVILLKGYQNWSGRALVGIKAIELVGESLRGFSVSIFGNPTGQDIRIAAELLSVRAHVSVHVLPAFDNHIEMLKLFSEARVYIGLSISDGISTSLLEAMAMGAFPIQSNTSTADEWIVDGRTGAIVPSEEPIEIANRIREALTDESLVDAASAANWQVITERADADLLKCQAIDIYTGILAERSKQRA